MNQTKGVALQGQCSKMDYCSKIHITPALPLVPCYTELNGAPGSSLQGRLKVSLTLTGTLKFKVVIIGSVEVPTATLMVHIDRRSRRGKQRQT